MERRLRKLKQKMKRKGLDALLVTGLKNVSYLTGYSGSSARLFVGRRAHFFTDFRYQEQSRKEVISKAVIHIIKKGYAAEIASLTEVADRELRAGFEAAQVTVQELGSYRKAFRKVARVKWIPTTDMVEELRLVKDPDEIELIARAASITDKTYKEVLALIKPGITERALAAEIDYRFLKYSGLPPAFSTIVASGPNSAMPHAKPTTRKLRNGDFVTFDMGAQWRGYASDFTRTVVIGKASAKHREIYAIVGEAQRRAVAGIKAGITSKAADALARDYISRKGYGEYFGHSLGHGVGLHVHEAPRLASASNGKIPAGAVVTIEPGIYLPGWGGVRIEDLAVVTRQGSRVLSKVTRKLIEI